MENIEKLKAEILDGEGWFQGDTYWYAKKEFLIIEKKITNIYL